MELYNFFVIYTDKYKNLLLINEKTVTNYYSWNRAHIYTSRNIIFFIKYLSLHNNRLVYNNLEFFFFLYNDNNRKFCIFIVA